MARSYKPVDRDQLFLLPPDMREWLGEGHLAFFVVDVVARVDTSCLHEAHPNDGPGRQAYDPEMLLALLLYAYATGERSSRQVERLCEVDVGYRVVAANQRPDHTTIARFRSSNTAAIARLFTEVLRLCHEAGLVSLGVIAVDGTRMKANAAKKANKTAAEVEAEVEEVLRQAAERDAEEDAAYGQKRGDELPEELADPRRRKARLDRALGALRAKQAEAEAAEAERAARHEAAPGRPGPPPGPLTVAVAEDLLERAEAGYRAAFADWQRQRDAARARGGPVPPRPNRHPRANARRRLERLRSSPPPPPPPARPVTVNTTDLCSQLMRCPGGWVQGYNAQAAVDAGGVVVAARVTTSHRDSEQFGPMVETTMAELAAAGAGEEVGTMLFDAGYCSEANLTAPGPDRLIATKKSSKLRREARLGGFAEGGPPAGASPAAAMGHRLRTEEGAALYGLRQQLVEPAFGDLKENSGFRAFLLRGLDACDAEWKLMCAAKNLKKLFRATGATA